MQNILEGLIEDLMQAVGAEAVNFSTVEGDHVAVVNMQGILSLGILENNERMANAVFTKAEAKRLSDVLAKFAAS